MEENATTVNEVQDTGAAGDAPVANERAEAENAEIIRLKNALTKANSEAAELKKQLRAKMTDDEANKLEREARWKEMEEKVQQLELEKTESYYKARYLAMPGFDEKLAEATAKAMASGDMDTVFANQKKASDNHEKKLRADLVRQDPRPGNVGGGEPESDVVAYAKRLAAKRAASKKASEDILKNYIK